MRGECRNARWFHLVEESKKDPETESGTAGKNNSFQLHGGGRSEKGTESRCIGVRLKRVCPILFALNPGEKTGKAGSGFGEEKELR